MKQENSYLTLIETSFIVFILIANGHDLMFGEKYYHDIISVLFWNILAMFMVIDFGWAK